MYFDFDIDDKIIKLSEYAEKELQPGKTTALRCISGIITFDEGCITIDGIDVSQNSSSLSLRPLCHAP